MTAAHALGPLAPLAEYRQFIPVKLVPLPNGKMDKLPIDHRTGGVTAKGTDGAHNPDIWLSYEHAALIASVLGPQHGVGFVLTADDPFVAVDIDNCLTPEGWSPLALELIAALPGAVVEISQSGKGLHVWLRSLNMPAHTKKNTALGLECYSSRRFILLGSHANGTMADDCPGIKDVVARYFAPHQTTHADLGDEDEGPAAEWCGPTDDEELLALAMRSRSAASAFGDGVTFKQLNEADADALGRKWPSTKGDAFDRSSADMALASHFLWWTGRDVPRTEQLMRGSGLMREKYDRPDGYLLNTIRNARKLRRDFYRAPAPAAVTSTPAVASAAPIDSADPGRFKVIKDDPATTARALLHRRYRHADGPRLMCWQGSFYEWNGANWRELQDADVAFLTYDFLDRLKDSNYLPKKATVSELQHALSNAAYVKSDAAPPCWINDDGTRPPAAEIIACANGLLHLPSRTTTPPTPRFFSLNSLPFPYEPNAPRPVNWLRFLDQVWPNDPEAISTLQEMFGYLLTPDTSQQKIFLLVGPRRSGKGTIGRVLNAVLGLENVASPALGEMSGRFGLQPLVGALAALISDARLGAGPEQKKVAENLLRISGEDRVLVDRKGVKALTLRLGVRFVLMTNELPRIADASGAMASRFVILSMSESFLGREDPGLTAKLLPELSGVLAWAVEGWHRLNARGHFVEPRSSAAAVQELADLGSPISAFVRDECVLAPGAEVEVGKLHSAWAVWCARRGTPPTDSAAFGRDLFAAFTPHVKKARPRVGGERQSVYQGLALRS